MHIAIIGAGLVGLCTAYSLQRTGNQVTLVDRREGPALETSFANGGLLTPSMSQPWNAPGVHRALLKSIGRSDSAILLRARALPSIGRWGIAFLRGSRPSNYIRNTQRNFRLGRYSLQVMDEIAPSLPAPNPVHRTGSLNIHRGKHELKAGVAEATVLAAEGLAWTLLSPRDCVTLEPLLAGVERQIAGGIHFPDDRSGDAHRYCEIMASAIRDAGGTFLFDTAITGWYRDGPRVRAAHSNKGSIEADCFVIATGSYSRELARSLGIDVPVYPAKGYSLSISADGMPDMPRVPVVDSSLHAAVASIGGYLRVAGTAEFTGFDTRIPAARIRNLESLLRQLYPELARYALAQPTIPWAGLRPMSSDGVPIISRTDIDNVYLNTGHGHLGWTLSAGSGHLLAQLVVGQTPELDLSSYSLDRFRRH